MKRGDDDDDGGWACYSRLPDKGWWWCNGAVDLLEVDTRTKPLTCNNILDFLYFLPNHLRIVLTNLFRSVFLVIESALVFTGVTVRTAKRFTTTTWES